MKRYSSGMRCGRVCRRCPSRIRNPHRGRGILSVGDYAFQAKCLEKMRSIVAEQGRTVLFVSHNLTTVEHFCPRTILMDAGRVVIDGPTDEAIAKFLRQFPHAGRGSGAGIFDLAAGDRSGGGYRQVLKTLEFRPRVWARIGHHSHGRVAADGALG